MRNTRVWLVPALLIALVAFFPGCGSEAEKPAQPETPETPEHPAVPAPLEPFAAELIGLWEAPELDSEENGLFLRLDPGGKAYSGRAGMLAFKYTLEGDRLRVVPVDAEKGKPIDVRTTIEGDVMMQREFDAPETAPDIRKARVPGSGGEEPIVGIWNLGTEMGTVSERYTPDGLLIVRIVGGGSPFGSIDSGGMRDGALVLAGAQSPEVTLAWTLDGDELVLVDENEEKHTLRRAEFEPWYGVPAGR